MNSTQSSSVALSHYDIAMQDTSGLLVEHKKSFPVLVRNDTIDIDPIEAKIPIHNISAVLLQPIRGKQDMITELMLALDLYYTPGIMAIGFTANIYASFVIRNSAFSKLSVAPYMSALTACDTAYLVARLLTWLWQTHHIDVICTPGLCQLVWFTLYVCNFLSIWYVLCLQIDRYISMWHPTKARHRGSNKQSQCITSIMAVLSVIIYSIVLWTSGVLKDSKGQLICNFLPKYLDIVRIFVKADTFVTAVMPYFMLPMVNIIILLQVAIKCCSLQRYKSPPSNAGPRSRRAASNVRKTRKQVKVTLSLLVVSSLIWGINVLSQWLRIRNFFRFTASDLDINTSRTPKASGHIAWYLAEHLYHLSFAIKLLLYICFSGIFRSSLLECCRTYQCICTQCNETDEDDEQSACDLCEYDYSYEGSMEALPTLEPIIDSMHDIPNNLDNSHGPSQSACNSVNEEVNNLDYPPSRHRLAINHSGTNSIKHSPLKDTTV